MFMIENDLENNYFDRYSVLQLNLYQRNIDFIGIGTTRDQIINPSSQFAKCSCLYRSRSLTNHLKNNYDRIKILLKIHAMLQDKVIITHKIINNIASSNQSSNSKADDDVSSFLFVKDLFNHKYF